MILQGGYHLMEEITAFQAWKIKYHKMLQLGDTISGWWVVEQGGILGVNTTWDILLRVCRCGSQMWGGRTPLEERPVRTKPWRWKNTTGNIKARKGSLWGWAVRIGGLGSSDTTCSSNRGGLRREGGRTQNPGNTIVISSTPSHKWQWPYVA